MTTIYEEKYNLPELLFVGGTKKVLTFTAYQEDGVNLLNLSGGSAVWLLCHYGDFSEYVLKITGNIATANTIEVTVPEASTLSLSGKFVQQIKVIDHDGNEFRPGEGIVVITPAIPET